MNFIKSEVLKNLIAKVEALIVTAETRSLKIAEIKNVAKTLHADLSVPYDATHGLWAVVDRNRTYEKVIQSLRYSLNHLNQHLYASLLAETPRFAQLFKDCMELGFKMERRGSRIYITRPDHVGVYVTMDGTGLRTDIDPENASPLKDAHDIAGALGIESWKVIDQLREEGATIPEAKRYVYKYGIASAAEAWASDRAGTAEEAAAKFRWVICDACEGNGKVGHPAFSNGITSSEWHDMDHDERDSYMRGDYDVQCDCCKGSGKVKVPDVRRMTHEEKRELVRQRQHNRIMAQLDREAAAERAMGA